MINFKIHSKIWEEQWYDIVEVFGKCQNCRSFDIFWDILDKMRGNLGQECVKAGLLSFQGKIGTIALISFER